ncbi:MAG: hypothetical protein Q7T55_02545 [Solirubrobacteraceae bacterium]|nr:hypothetical protein [Solirubrobacteraceae bacterium]
MSRLATLLTAAAVGLVSTGLVACGGTDDPVKAAVTPAANTSNGSGAVEVDESVTEVVECSKMRISDADYEDAYDRYDCSDYRRQLCRNVTRSTVRYDTYRCSRLPGAASRAKKAAKKRAVAKKRAAAKKRVAAKRAKSSSSATTKAKSTTNRASKTGGFGSTGKKRSSSSSGSSSSAGSSSSSSAGSSSSSGSSRSTSRRR